MSKDAQVFSIVIEPLLKHNMSTENLQLDINTALTLEPKKKKIKNRLQKTTTLTSFELEYKISK